MPEGDQESVLEKRRSEDFSAELAKTGWYHSIELTGGRTTPGFLGLAELKERWAEFPLPPDLHGKRVLDIGAWDGWFAFEAERRGAEVVAIDNVEQENFRYAHRELGSKSAYHIAEIYELPELDLGQFDYTLFLGVLYHLRHPLRALEIVCGLTKDLAIVDSFIVDDDSRGRAQSPIPWMEFYETTELSNQIDNWVGPTLECLLALCRASGFARVELLNIRHRHARLACYRRWEPQSASADAEAPVLHSVVNGRLGDQGINFNTRKEEFLTCWFGSRQSTLNREDLRLELAGFGTRALALAPVKEGEWYANFLLPPALERGWQEVRLRTVDSHFSNVRRIAVDLPVEAHALMIRAICDGVTWSQDEVVFRPPDNLAYAVLWIDGLGANCDRNNVRVYCDESRVAVDYVSGLEEVGTKQVNAVIPARIGSGEKTIRVEVGRVRSNQATILVRALTP